MSVVPRNYLVHNFLPLFLLVVSFGHWEWNGREGAMEVREHHTFRSQGALLREYRPTHTHSSLVPLHVVSSSHRQHCQRFE